MQTVHEGPSRTVRDVTTEEIRGWPATVDVVTGLAPFKYGRDGAYKAARDGSAPVPILRCGRRLLVTRSSVMTALGIPEAPTGVSADVARPP